MLYHSVSVLQCFSRFPDEFSLNPDLSGGWDTRAARMLAAAKLLGGNAKTSQDGLLTATFAAPDLFYEPYAHESNQR